VPLGMSDSKELGHYLGLAQVGLEMVAPIVLGLVLDHYAGCGPWGVIGGAIFGLVGGIVHLLSVLNKHDKPGTPKG
jgi:F0F1-type ATP synthase assembly protein I